MVRHIVSWSFNDNLSQEESIEVANKIKKDLENLTSIINGIVELKVIINVLPASNANILLNSLFESEEALAAYQVHPQHKSVGSYINQFLKDRRCIDYIE